MYVSLFYVSMYVSLCGMEWLLLSFVCLSVTYRVWMTARQACTPCAPCLPCRRVHLCVCLSVSFSVCLALPTRALCRFVGVMLVWNGGTLSGMCVCVQSLRLCLHSATHQSGGGMLVQRMTHCNTLQRPMTHCNTQHHTATHRTPQQHIAPHCDTRVQEAAGAFVNGEAGRQISQSVCLCLSLSSHLSDTSVSRISHTCFSVSHVTHVSLFLTLCLSVSHAMPCT